MFKNFFLFKHRHITLSSLREMMKKAEKMLDTNKHKLNTINVFPVADGDTGTNMHHTVKAISLSEDMVSAALDHARGNSGMIFSQFFIGFAGSMGEKASISGIADAFRKGYETAMSIVDAPKRGTMLDVMEKASSLMEKFSKKTSDISRAFSLLMPELKNEVMKTRYRMEVLKNAGVVDAGALGFLYVMEAWNAWLGGRPLDLEGLASYPVSVSKMDISHRFCTQILIETEKSSSDIVKLAKRYGIDVRAISMNGRTKLHVHTNSPSRLASDLSMLGKILDMRVEDMLKMRERHADSYRRIV